MAEVAAGHQNQLQNLSVRHPVVAVVSAPSGTTASFAASFAAFFGGSLRASALAAGFPGRGACYQWRSSGRLGGRSTDFTLPRTIPRGETICLASPPLAKMNFNVFLENCTFSLFFCSRFPSRDDVSVHFLLSMSPPPCNKRP